MTRPEILHFRTSDGIRLEAEAYGSGPVILLAHGGGQTRYSWRGVARAQAEKGWRTVALDLRGHGASDWDPAQDYSLERYAQDIAEVAAALGGGVYHVGASLGGNSAIPAVGRIAPGLFR
ncbi:MAG: alpha/beta fold hydrolase, partial [Paracoccaceae bacterium]